MRAKARAVIVMAKGGVTTKVRLEEVLEGRLLLQWGGASVCEGGGCFVMDKADLLCSMRAMFEQNVWCCGLRRYLVIYILVILKTSVSYENVCTSKIELENVGT